LFEGTAEQMFHGMERYSHLPDQTQVLCCHEYTASNAAFCLSVEPDNSVGVRRLCDGCATVVRRLCDGCVTVPSINPVALLAPVKSTSWRRRPCSPDSSNACCSPRTWPSFPLDCDDMCIFAARSSFAGYIGEAPSYVGATPPVGFNPVQSSPVRSGPVQSNASSHCL
jgi:hypothetical protein